MIMVVLLAYLAGYKFSGLSRTCLLFSIIVVSFPSPYE